MLDFFPHPEWPKVSVKVLIVETQGDEVLSGFQYIFGKKTALEINDNCKFNMYYRIHVYFHYFVTILPLLLLVSAADLRFQLAGCANSIPAYLTIDQSYAA